MLKNDVKKHFGSFAKAAQSLQIAPASISGWGRVIPKGRALELEHMTKGGLVYDPDMYLGKPKTILSEESIATADKAGIE